MIRLGVVAALPAEIRGLVNCSVEHEQRIALDSVGWVQLAGIGRDKAKQAAVELVNAGATALMSWGVAGGLDPSINTGTLLVPEAVLTAEGEVYRSDSRWHSALTRRLDAQLKFNRGLLAESRAPLTTGRDKLALFNRTRAVAVDMESASIASVAQQAILPFLIIRAVVDTAATNLPSKVTDAIEPNGRLRIKALVLSLLAHPTDLPVLIKLGKAFWQAQATLAHVARLAGPSLQAPGTNVA